MSTSPIHGESVHEEPVRDEPVRVERRVGQRFSYLLPVSLRQPATGIEASGFTQNVSSRGVFLFTGAALTEGAEIELTLRMPSEITLGENMPVRCRGRVLRVVRPASAATQASGRAETKIGVAVRLESYEYLPEPCEPSAALNRVASLHSYHDEEDRPAGRVSARTL
jgi:hypothetical protein